MALAAAGSAAVEIPAQALEQAMGDRENLSLTEGVVNTVVGGISPGVGALGTGVIKAVTGLPVVASPIASTGQRIVSAVVRGGEGAAIDAFHDTSLRLVRDEEVNLRTVGSAALFGFGLGSMAGLAFDEIFRSLTKSRMFEIARKHGFVGESIDDLRAWWMATEPPRPTRDVTPDTPAPDTPPCAPCP